MTLSIEVQAPPEQVFALVSDIGRYREWSPQAFEATRLDDGPIGAGLRYWTAGQRGTRQGPMRTTEVVVTDFEPPPRLGFAAMKRAGTYRTTFVITPSGRVRVEWIVDPPSTRLVPFIRQPPVSPVPEELCAEEHARTLYILQGSSWSCRRPGPIA